MQYNKIKSHAKINLVLNVVGKSSSLHKIESIISFLDLYDEISALTQATINGLIPFERSFKLRCKILSDVPVKKVQEIAQKVHKAGQYHE